jgi:hypothetical protein
MNLYQHEQRRSTLNQHFMSGHVRAGGAGGAVRLLVDSYQPSQKHRTRYYSIRVLEPLQCSNTSWNSARVPKADFRNPANSQRRHMAEHTRINARSVHLRGKQPRFPLANAEILIVENIVHDWKAATTPRYTTPTVPSSCSQHSHRLAVIPETVAAAEHPADFHNSTVRPTDPWPCWRY